MEERREGTNPVELARCLEQAHITSVMSLTYETNSLRRISRLEFDIRKVHMMNMESQTDPGRST